jgi:hypothetical protein
MYLNCKLCGKRAIFEPDRLYYSRHENGRKAEYMNVPHPLPDQTEAVPHVIVEDTPLSDKYACPDCGKEYQNKKRYDMYHKKCKARVS